MVKVIGPERVQQEEDEEEEEPQELPKSVREARTREAAEPRPNLASPSFFDATQSTLAPACSHL